MKFALVTFNDEKTCSVVQQSWIDYSKQKCSFPSTKDFNKFIQKELDSKKIKKWPSYDISIEHDNIESYDQAKQLAKNISDFGDTEGENFLRQQREETRARIIMGDNLDLTAEMNRAKEEYIDGVISNEQSIIDQEYLGEEMSTEVSKSDDGINSGPHTSSMMERVDIDKDALILYIKQIVEESKKDILAKMDELKKEINALKFNSGFTLEENFQKIGSTKKFKEFIELMKVESNRKQLIRELKLQPDTTGSKNASHGTVATMMQYIFAEKFIVKRLKWGEMKGQESSTRKIYLVNYPIIYEIAAGLLSNATPKEIRNSFQNFFKHRVKKIAA